MIRKGQPRTHGAALLRCPWTKVIWGQDGSFTGGGQEWGKACHRVATAGAIDNAMTGDISDQRQWQEQKENT